VRCVQPQSQARIHEHTGAVVMHGHDTYVQQSLISGEDLDQVAIRGRGTIDGQGTKHPPPAHWPEFKTRPYVIRLVNCRDVLIEGVTLRDSVMWMQHYLACERVRIHGVTVMNFACHCSDGLDIDGCRDAVVSDCKFESDDDSLCLKSTSLRPCENVTISNCLISSHCNGIKMGTETLGGFRNITITNCTISSPAASSPLLHGVARGMAGVALELVDGDWFLLPPRGGTEAAGRASADRAARLASRSRRRGRKTPCY